MNNCRTRILCKPFHKHPSPCCPPLPGFIRVFCQKCCPRPHWASHGRAEVQEGRDSGKGHRQASLRGDIKWLSGNTWCAGT